MPTLNQGKRFFISTYFTYLPIFRVLLDIYFQVIVMPLPGAVQKEIRSLQAVEKHIHQSTGKKQTK